MNRNEITEQSNKDIKTLTAKSRFLTSQFKDSSQILGGLTLTPEEILACDSEDSFLSNSPLVKLILSKAKGDVSLTELMTIAQTASAIEHENTKAYLALRDTSGEKPIDKVQKVTNPVHRLSDDQLNKILEVVDIDEED